jgi:hypothetical protein
MAPRLRLLTRRDRYHSTHIPITELGHCFPGSVKPDLGYLGGWNRSESRKQSKKLPVDVYRRHRRGGLVERRWPAVRKKVGVNFLDGVVRSYRAAVCNLGFSDNRRVISKFCIWLWAGTRRSKSYRRNSQPTRFHSRLPVMAKPSTSLPRIVRASGDSQCKKKGPGFPGPSDYCIRNVTACTPDCR